MFGKASRKSFLGRSVALQQFLVSYSSTSTLEWKVSDASFAHREQAGALGINDWSVKLQKGHSVALCLPVHPLTIDANKKNLKGWKQGRLLSEFLKSLLFWGGGFLEIRECQEELSAFCSTRADIHPAGFASFIGRAT